MAAALTHGLDRLSCQQLAGPLGLEVVAGDVLTVTAVQHLLIAVLLLLLGMSK